MSIITATLIGTIAFLILLVIFQSIELVKLRHRELILLDRLMEMVGTRPLTPVEKTMVETAHKEAQRKEKSRISFRLPNT